MPNSTSRSNRPQFAANDRMDVFLTGLQNPVPASLADQKLCLFESQRLKMVNDPAVMTNTITAATAIPIDINNVAHISPIGLIAEGLTKKPRRIRRSI